MKPLPHQPIGWPNQLARTSWWAPRYPPANQEWPQRLRPGLQLVGCRSPSPPATIQRRSLPSLASWATIFKSLIFFKYCINIWLWSSLGKVQSDAKQGHQFLPALVDVQGLWGLLTSCAKPNGWLACPVPGAALVWEVSSYATILASNGCLIYCTWLTYYLLLPCWVQQLRLLPCLLKDGNKRVIKRSCPYSYQYSYDNNPIRLPNVKGGLWVVVELTSRDCHTIEWLPI